MRVSCVRATANVYSTAAAPPVLSDSEIALGCDLTVVKKWGKPCFTYDKRNVAIVIPLKEACALSFFKGVLLEDPKRVLQKIGEHAQAGRWIKFTSLEEVTAMQSILRSYLYEAIEIEQSGKKIARKKDTELAVPEELQARWMRLRSCGPHSMRSRRGGGSPTSFTSPVRSGRRRAQRGWKGVCR